MIPHRTVQLHTDVSGLLSAHLHSLSFGGSLHCSPMDAWKLKTRKVQEVSMEKAEVELDTENFMEEEGGEKITQSWPHASALATVQKKR